MGRLRIQRLESEHAPVGTSRLRLAGRPFVSVTWQFDGLEPIFGEASPLRGYGNDNLALAERELKQLTDTRLVELARRVAEAFDPDVSEVLVSADSPLGQAAAWSGRFRSPSVRFCGEMLVLRAAARSCGVPVWRLLSAECVAPALPTSSVIDPLSEDFELGFSSEYERGIRTYKVKCGRDRAREIEAILRMAPAPGVRLRLDPNGAWSLEEAESFLARLPAESLEWVEDPTADPSQWPRIRETTGISVALDEPISMGISADRARDMAPDVVVVKPMAVGGISACVKWALLARTWGARVCVSHLFDGRAAMDAAIHLAFAIQSADRAPGLGVHPAISTDPSSAPDPAGLFTDLLRCPDGRDSKG